MAQTTCRRGREGGITFPAFAAAARGETPSPGVELVAQAGSPAAASAGSSTGAASKRGRALEVVRCPLCGKSVRKQAMPAHALAHLEKLELHGIIKMERENGGWTVYCNGRKYIGAGWRTLLCLAEQLAKEERVMAGG